jgi:hypothetical protein
MPPPGQSAKDREPRTRQQPLRQPVDKQAERGRMRRCVVSTFVPTKKDLQIDGSVRSSVA